ncbi:unnamed protein product [Rotaria magnacalcarata]|nr:unnamed protein product [Rotaria magnacalcarata]CAF1651021.1 unnamed protein product [Rotaria magnacalcarata]CAF4301240.1 unnamed protein product [Rotaria magnacalcarata]CAF4636363.1 unnamed protein product [Rotaria magnacalcarata]CAF4808100.1 unnamed protein product [Rotaria magnacalcarata]
MIPVEDDSSGKYAIVKEPYFLFNNTKINEILGLVILIGVFIAGLIALIVVITRLDDTSDKQSLTHRKILSIVVDGISADVIENIAVEIPTMRKIQQIGCYTRAYVGGDDNNYTQTPAISAPGYMNLLTENNSAKQIAIFSTWTDNRIKLIGEGLADAGNITFDYKFDGYEFDEITYPHDSEAQYIFDIDQRVTNETATCIKTYGPDLSWVYLQFTDDAGHEFGDSEKFNQAVTNADRQIGQIWEAIDYRMKNYKEDWAIIITTDHGRDPITGADHGNQTPRERTTWIIANGKEMNGYFKDFQPAIVDIYPTIAKLFGLNIPVESERELDGVPLTGQVSLIKPNVQLLNASLHINWTILDPSGDVKIWLSTTNLFQNGMKDNYDLIEVVPINNNAIVVDIARYPSNFYKIILEGQYNTINRWVSRL